MGCAKDLCVSKEAYNYLQKDNYWASLKRVLIGMPCMFLRTIGMRKNVHKDLYLIKGCLLYSRERFYEKD